MVRLTVIFSFILIGVSLNAQQDPFGLYVEKNEDWYPVIFEVYIKQYAGINVNKLLIDGQQIGSIISELKKFKPAQTKNITEAMTAAQYGKKVFFFIENWSWGSLEARSTYSVNWEQQMPMCSGFYVSKKKCFQHEGLNYHCRKKNESEIIFLIFDI